MSKALLKSNSTKIVTWPQSNAWRTSWQTRSRADCVLYPPLKPECLQSNKLLELISSPICRCTTLSKILDSSHKFAIGRVSDGEDGGFTLRRGRRKARFQDRGKWPNRRLALNRRASKGARLGRALWIEKREMPSGPAAREGEVVETIIWETYSEETEETKRRDERAEENQGPSQDQPPSKPKRHKIQNRKMNSAHRQ